MKTLIMLAGIPGSGKSRWARQYALDNPGTFVVDGDETRKRMMGSYLTFPKDMHVIFDDMIKEANDDLARADCETLILDSIFLVDYRRIYFMSRISGCDRSVLLLAKMHDYSLCYVRNRARIPEKWVPDYVIDEMIRQYKDPSPAVARLFSEVRTLYLDEPERRLAS